MSLKQAFVAIFSSIAVLATGAAFAGGKGGSGSKSGASKSSASKGADYRSAKSGKYVKKEFAEKHKDTTVREARKGKQSL